MNRSVNPTTPIFRISAAAAVLALVAGCHSSTGPLSSLSVSNNADDLSLIAQTFDRGATDALHYTWSHSSTVATISPCINDPSGVPVCTNITAGTVGVVIKDAAGTTVYSKDLKDVGAQDTSAAGTSGNWTVDVTLAAAMGNFIFEVRKAPRSLTVTATTTGTNLDSDGYTATLDGAGSQTVGGNGSATFTNLSPASHTVVLSGVAANCSVSGGASRTFTVPAGGTTTAAFSVTCT